MKKNQWMIALVFTLLNVSALQAKEFSNGEFGTVEIEEGNVLSLNAHKAYYTLFPWKPEYREGWLDLLNSSLGKGKSGFKISRQLLQELAMIGAKALTDQGAPSVKTEEEINKTASEVIP